MNKFTHTLSAIVLGLCATQGFAQEQGNLSVKTVVAQEQITVDAAGKEHVVLKPATKVVPGDEVVYTVTFTNISSAPAEKVVITNPLPNELTYVDGSAFGPGTSIQFSVNGGKTYGEPDELEVTANGETRAAAAKDFTHIRWVMDDKLQAGDQGMARFRARLN